MSEEWQAYVKDSRTNCKYGSKCYQKNPDHHKLYKHPPLTLKKNVGNRFKPYRKHSPNKVGPTTLHRNNQDNQEVQNDTSNIELPDTLNSTANTIQQISGSTIKCEEQSLSQTKSQEILEAKVSQIVTYYDKNTDISLLKKLFLVEMPHDFFKFFECLHQENESLEKILSSVNLEPIGPFDLLLGKLPILDDKELYLIHWRFFYDPPEFQAVLKVKGKSQFHIGYYRDDPNEPPVFMASNDSSKDYTLTPIADNIFGAVYFYLQNQLNRSPFTALASKRLMEKIKKCAEEHHFSIEEYNKKQRLLKIVTKTLHGAGIVVPYNKKTQLGYRPLVESDANIKKLLKKLEDAKSKSEKDAALSELQPVITYASIAVDECDFGTGLELGINLFCSGLVELQPSALNSLNAAYSLLNRQGFGEIIKAHMKRRRKGPDMSVLSALGEE